MSIRELLQQKAELVKEGRSLLDAAKKESRAITEEEGAKYQEITAKIDGITRSITVEQAQIEAERDMPAVQDDNVEAENRSKKNNDQPVYRDFGSFLKDVAMASSPDGNHDASKQLRAATGMGETIGSTGGFLVQKDFSSELLTRMYDSGAISSRVRRLTVSGNGLKINAVDETSRANGSRFGGVQVYWNDEGDVMTPKKPKFRQMELSLKKVTGLCYATDELLADAAALESIISQSFVDELNYTVEDNIINGTGAGTPLGVLNGGSKVSVSKESGQAAATFKYENALKMWSRMWARSRPNAVWFINQDVEPQLNAMTLAVGTGGVPVYLPPSGASGSPYGTLFGRPVILVEQCATLGTEGDVILADLSQYLMIEKGGIQSASSMHVRFLYDEMTYRFTYRVDGQPIWNAPLTPANGSNTLSPFITLATRA